MSEQGQIIDTGVEALYCGALQRPAPFYAKVLEPIDNGEGYWNSFRVGIFARPEADIKAEGYSNPKVSNTDVQIGEYKRNYHSMMRTFHPFQLRDRWYALYSKDYTATRLMKLPSCEDIGGEGRAEGGFCPVDFWVPPLSYIEDLHDEGCPRDDKRGHTPDGTKACTCGIVHNPETCPTINKSLWENITGASRSCTCQDLWAAYYETHHIWRFPERVHGFVAGCIWGDDGSWKIEYLDLSRADEGIVKPEARFGYISIPSALDLNKAITMDADDDYISLRIATEDYYDLATGKKGN